MTFYVYSKVKHNYNNNNNNNNNTELCLASEGAQGPEMSSFLKSI